jgi:outer membrane protein TolC
VGASVVIPLDVFTASKAADGYKLTYNASKDAYRDKALETDQAWAQLKDRLDDVNKRLEMATRIEDIQKRKLAKEREQLNVGRSTQFQLQSFETDYQMSRLQRLGVQAEKLFLWAEAEWLLSADRADAENGKSVAKAEVK